MNFKPDVRLAGFLMVELLYLAVLGTPSGLFANQETSAATESDTMANPARIEWISIPGTMPGKPFRMGSAHGASTENPAHDVAVKSFEMAKTAVTVEQYKACVAARKKGDPNGCTAAGLGYDYDQKTCNWGKPGREKHPINCVTWDQAAAFAKWAGGRLPSEAEWEYAAQSAGQDGRYPWGDDEPTCEKVVAGCHPDSTWPVGSKPAGNTKQGLSDMAGNVSEWVQDGWHASYEGAPNDGTAWGAPDSSVGPLHVIRGGEWSETHRVSWRNYENSGFVSSSLGFRIIRELIQSSTEEDAATPLTIAAEFQGWMGSAALFVNTNGESGKDHWFKALPARNPRPISIPVQKQTLSSGKVLYEHFQPTPGYPAVQFSSQCDPLQKKSLEQALADHDKMPSRLPPRFPGVSCTVSILIQSDAQRKTRLLWRGGRRIAAYFNETNYSYEDPRITSASLSPDGKYLLVGWTEGDKRAYLFLLV
jgi:formylglycine-generating enzyme required for sulfatase activity